MPKIKTKRAAAKRFKVTGTGKLKRSKANKSHILTKKTTKRTRNLRKTAVADKTNVKQIKKLVPLAKIVQKIGGNEKLKDFSAFLVASTRNFMKSIANLEKKNITQASTVNSNLMKLLRKVKNNLARLNRIWFFSIILSLRYDMTQGCLAKSIITI